MNLRTVLLALPTLYLLIALVFMNGRSPRLPNVWRPEKIFHVGVAVAPPPAKHDLGITTLAGAPVNSAALVPLGVPRPVVVEEELAPPAPVVAAPRQAEAVVAAGASPPPPKPAHTELKKIKFYDGNVVNVHPHPEAGTGPDWWPSVEHGWEKSTLQAIRTMLSMQPGATYVDFGSWIGPTVLFASTYATKVYSLEPDFSAFSELYWNVQANPQFASKVTVESLCIAGAAGQVVMHGQPGSSMPAIGTVEESEKARKVKGRTEWTVECTTLDEYFERKGIDPSNVVIKMDTEGAEKDILIQLKPWIAKYKPSMLLSMHAFAYPTDEKAHHALQEIIMSYKTVRFPNGKEVNRQQFSVGGWCRLCALLLTDLPLQQSDVK